MIDNYDGTMKEPVRDGIPPDVICSVRVIAAGCGLALFLPGMGRGLLLTLLSPLVASAELGMVCFPSAYTGNKTARGKRKGQRHDPTARNPAGNLEK